jgi:prevent-host-death family protein
VKVANLSKVKNELSRYVDLVRRGEHVRILVNGVPAADLVPVAAVQAEVGDEELAELERRGIIVRGRGPWPAELDRPGPSVRGRAGTRALLAERAEGR